MNNKTIIIANNNHTSNQLENWVAQQMPDLKLTGKAKTPIEKQALMKNNLEQQVFVNIHDITAEQFMQLKQMQKASFSILFITTDFMEERLSQIPEYLMAYQTPEKTGVELRIGGNIQFISYDKIIRLEACSNYTKIYTTDSAKPILTSKTLKCYVDKLDEQMFLRPHKSHLVNKNFVHKISSNRGWTIVLSNGDRIKISRRKVKAVRNRLQKELTC